MLVLFLLEGFNGAVRALQTDALQHLAHVFAEAVKVFAAQSLSFSLFFRGNYLYK